MKRFLIQTSVENAEGSQTWYVDAKTEADALKKYNDGDCNMYVNEVEVTSLGEPELAGETTLDDFGDFATAPQRDSSATPRTWVGLTLDEQSDCYEKSGGNLSRFAKGIEAKLKEKNERLEKNT